MAPVTIDIHISQDRKLVLRDIQTLAPGHPAMCLTPESDIRQAGPPLVVLFDLLCFIFLQVRQSEIISLSPLGVDSALRPPRGLPASAFCLSSWNRQVCLSPIFIPSLLDGLSLASDIQLPFDQIPCQPAWNDEMQAAVQRV